MNQRALAGLNVIEYAEMVSGPYCARLLGDLGARVIKIEKPGQGDEARRHGPFWHNLPHSEGSGLFLYLNSNKQGLTLNLRNATGRNIFIKLLQDADVLVENHPPGFMAEQGCGAGELLRLYPRLVITSVTPFGQSGPNRDAKGGELISFHASGVGYETPGDVEDLEAEPPLKAAGRQGGFQAGLVAATATLLALFQRQLTGRGQVVDISEQEALLDAMRPSVAFATYAHRFLGRLRPAFRQIMPTKDGYVAAEPWDEPHFWEGWKRVMGQPDWAESEAFQTREARQQNWEALWPLVTEWTQQHTKEEIYRAAQAEHLPSFPVNTPGEVVASEHLRARSYFVEVEHPHTGKVRYPGALCRFSETPMTVRRPAPLLGQDNEAILCGQLGFTREELVKLHESGTI
ncbi:MAG: CoA transferase [Chloroflexota bacterium]|nr:CoA transferase [Chloroflexota bacterium]